MCPMKSEHCLEKHSSRLSVLPRVIGGDSRAQELFRKKAEWPMGLKGFPLSVWGPGLGDEGPGHRAGMTR